MLKKKSLGQNFLKSKSVVETIIDSSDITPDDIVLEVGPGEGFMTEELVKWSGKVICIEKDHRLIPVLEEKFKAEIKLGKVKLIEKDILLFDLDFLKSSKYKLVANIPYYITGQIIRKFLEADFKPELMTLLVQMEVADRIVAKDGKESLLSLSIKVFGDPKFVKKISKGNFNPAPTVDSAIVTVENISNKKLDGLDPENFFKVIHAGFAHKRKQLLPNLSNIFNREEVSSSLEILGISEKIRAEDLSLEKWILLAKNLVK